MAIETGKGLAVVTGASTGIGYELAKCAAEEGYDLIIAADEPRIKQAAETLKQAAVSVEAIETDLSTEEGVDRLLEAIEASGRSVDLLMANAGRGLGKGFLDQDFAAARKVVDTNIVGTIYLVQQVGNLMRSRKRRTHSADWIDCRLYAGFIPGGL